MTVPLAPFQLANCRLMNHDLWRIWLPRTVQLCCWCFWGYPWACCEETCPRFTQLVVDVSISPSHNEHLINSDSERKIFPTPSLHCQSNTSASHKAFKQQHMALEEEGAWALLPWFPVIRFWSSLNVFLSNNISYIIVSLNMIPWILWQCTTAWK